jgi:MerR family transcriptional regulator, copper efflux regulator
MRIGDLARAAGVSVSTVRFYEAQGLLPKPETRESGYREYGDRDLQRLRLIVASKRQRFPLKLIRTCLDALEH